MYICILNLDQLFRFKKIWNNILKLTQILLVSIVIFLNCLNVDTILWLLFIDILSRYLVTFVYNDYNDMLYYPSPINNIIYNVSTIFPSLELLSHYNNYSNIHL